MLAKFRAWLEQADTYFDTLTRREQAIVAVAAGLIAVVCLGSPRSVLALIRLVGICAVGVLCYALTRLHEDEDDEW